MIRTKEIEFKQKITRQPLGLGPRPAAALLLVDDQVDGHLAFEAADVAVAEVVTQLVNLKKIGDVIRTLKKALTSSELCNIFLPRKSHLLSNH
jgi:hypothetical protein